MTRLATNRALRAVSGTALALGLLFLSGTGTHAAATAWARIDNPALSGGGHVVYVKDVAAPQGGQGWLAAGYVVDSDGARTPTAWSSADGIAWSRSTLPPTSSSERRDGVYEVTRRGSITVAIGSRFDGTVRPAAWRAEGDVWKEVDEDQPMLNSGGSLETVTAAPDGFYAVTVDHSGTRSAVAVFSSLDGRFWSSPNVLPIGDGEGFQPYSVLSAAGRIIVAGDSAIGGEADGRIWSLVDGMWRQVDPVAAQLSGPGLQQVASVTFRPETGFVAGGVFDRAGVEVPTVWISPDGLAWQRLPDSAVPSPSGGGAIHQIVPAGAGFLASGSSSSGPLLWQSPDGRHWTAIDAPKRPQPGGESVRVAAAAGVTVLDVAYENGSLLYRQATGGPWAQVEKPPVFPATNGGGVDLRGVATTGSRVVAVGSDTKQRPLVLVSDSGRTWRRVSFDDPPARLLAVAANRGVFVIAGWRLVRGTARLALWSSKTGTAWRQIGGFATSTPGAFVDIAPAGRAFAAISLEGSGRGLSTAVWSGDSRWWRSEAILGLGEARAICSGPNGVTAVAVTGEAAAERVIAWHRGRSGAWSTDRDIVAAAADATHCEDGPAGTVVVGTNNNNGAAVVWRGEADGIWNASAVANTAPRTILYDVTRDGQGFLMSGSSGARGQADLAVWRSPDGISWSSVGGAEPVFTEPGYQAGLGIVRHKGRVVVVGRTGAGNGGIWVGS